jgi:hypothetical protein
MEKRARGCLRVLTGTMMGYARVGDVDGLRAYLSSDAFADLFIGVDPGRRQIAAVVGANGDRRHRAQ